MLLHMFCQHLVPTSVHIICQKTFIVGAVVQAADFLDDSETLKRACHGLANLAFPVGQSERTDEQLDQGIHGSNTAAPGNLQVCSVLGETASFDSTIANVIICFSVIVPGKLSDLAEPWI